jgi:hypothetical protein
MLLDPQTAAARYAIIRDELRQQAPAAWAEVVQLAQDVPAQITPDSFWQFGKSMPCWSNIHVTTGGCLAANLESSPDFDHAEKIASPDWEIRMRSTGRTWKKNGNFELVGPAVRAFVSGLPAKSSLRNYLWRLFAIREFAKSLTTKPALIDMINVLINSRFDFGPDGIYKWACRFAQLAGRGWGPTTVMHLLTNLGFTIKPDVHVRYSAVRIGLLTPEYASTLSEDYIKNKKETLDPLAVHAIMAMVPYVDPVANPQAALALREIDKVMMEWSKQELARPF